MHRLTA